MSQELLLADFSQGMNAVNAVDKLRPNELLLAENVRLDERGNVLSAGANSKQNTAAYVSTATSSKVHSLYWNPSLGGVAGVGKDVFQGTVLGSMTSALGGKNTSAQKMSFASAPGRVYFDVGNTGYWSDMTNLLLVDWAPPSATSAVTTGPNTAATFTSNTAEGFGFALSTAQPMQGVAAGFIVTGTFVSDFADGTATTTLSATLLVNGVAVGTAQTEGLFFYLGAIGTQTLTFTSTLGGANNLWGDPTLTPAQVNGATFGVVFSESQQAYHGTLSGVTFASPTITAYQQASGFVVGTGAAGTLTGTYTWKVTFAAANGEESDGSVASTSVVLSAQQGTITAIPKGDARTTARNIYRKGGALTAYYLVGSIPDNVATTFADNQTDIAALTEGVILAGDVPGDFPNSRLTDNWSQVRYPCLHYDRIFWVNQAQPNQLLWSKPLNGFAYPSVNSADVGDSKPISRIFSIFGELIIIKTDSVWRLTGTDESSFDLSQTPSSVGTDEPFSCVQLPDRVIFANRWGLWAFNGYTSVPLTPKLDLWFRQDDRTAKSLFGVNGFHPPEVVNGGVTAAFDAVGNAEKYVLAYAESGQAQNNAALILDLKGGGITKRSIDALSLAIDPVTGFVYFGDAGGFVSHLDDWNATTDRGSAVNFDFQTGYNDPMRGSNKVAWMVEFFINTNGQNVTPHIYYDNGVNSETLAAFSTASLARVQRPLQATNSRKIQNISFRLNGSISPANVSGTPQVQLVHIKLFYAVYVGRPRTGQ